MDCHARLSARPDLGAGSRPPRAPAGLEGTTSLLLRIGEVQRGVGTSCTKGASPLVQLGRIEYTGVVPGLTTCEPVIHPADCLRGCCPRLTYYTDARDSTEWMYCQAGVFDLVIRTSDFDAIEAESKAGFGGVPVTGTLCPQCQKHMQWTKE